jgi:Scramblase
MGSVPIVTSKAYAPPNKTVQLDQVLVGGGCLLLRRYNSMFEDTNSVHSFKRYEILTEGGDLAGEGFEAARSPLDVMANRFRTTSRCPSHIDIVSNDARFMTIERPAYWFCLAAAVTDQGGVIGTIRQRFRLLTTQLDVIAGDGRLLATITNRPLHPRTFIMRRADGRAELARIQKQWLGVANQLFGKEVFALQLTSDREPVLHRLALAATILIDFLYLEDAKNAASANMNSAGGGFNVSLS